jgi:hypothetical protein
MPKDPRLYMTFPIDAHRHPKLMRLDVAVRWTFFEMNGEARIADNDGVFDATEAEFLWPVEHLAALVASHPTRPLVVRSGDTYVIREFAEHQYTKAQREHISEVNRQNGRLGGRPRKNRVATESQPSRSRTKAEIELELATSNEVATRKRGSRVPKDFTLTPELRAWAALEVPLVDIDKKLLEWIDYWSGVPGDRGVKVDWIGTWRNGMRKQQEFAVKDGVKKPPRMQTVADLAEKRRQMREEPRG